MNTLLAAGWGPLIPFIVFFVFLTLSLLHAAYRRSQRSDQSEPGGWDRSPDPLEQGDEVAGGMVVGRYVRPSTPPPMMAPNPRPLSPWEQELEQILRREPPKLPSPVVEPIRPVPAVPSPGPFDWRLVNPGPSVEELAARDLEGAPMPTKPLASLASAQKAYANAANLQERVQNFLLQVDAGVDRPVAAVPIHRPVVSTEITAFVAGFRSPVTARQALLASLVFGPPKALEH